ncbi:MAG: NAD+ synthase [Candidatus Aminicenantes bacterium]|nr:NAD+ synthase [Candidatus Aminicenantes bacterium]
MTINPRFVEKVLTAFIRQELSRFGFKNGILGLSGGLDSAVSASLAVRALGASHVIALILPYGTSFSRDVRDAKELAERFRIRSRVIDIAPMVDAYFSGHPTQRLVLKGNKMARERMSILYDYSEREKALIIGTSNKTELLIGYGTIHGDMACAINPLGDLYKTQIRELGRTLGLPPKILRKKPTAGLWPGQTDEDEIGMSYAEVDRILYHLVDLRETRREIAGRSIDRRKVERIASLIRSSEFKRKLPPIAKISVRSVGHDFLYPYDRDR